MGSPSPSTIETAIRRVPPCAHEIAHERTLRAQCQPVLAFSTFEPTTVSLLSLGRSRRPTRANRARTTALACLRARARNGTHAISGSPLTTSLYTLRCVTNFRISPVVVSDEVATALREGRGVVALETTIIVQGLARTHQLRCRARVRGGGAPRATPYPLRSASSTADVVVGLTVSELERLPIPTCHAAKLSARDLGVAARAGHDGATTVAGHSSRSPSASGIDVMATGGLGGVHRDAQRSFDESADLMALARTWCWWSLPG